MASRSEKTPQGGFLGVLQKAKGKRKEKQPSAELPHAPKKTRVIPPATLRRSLRRCPSKRIPSFVPDGLFAPMMLGCQIVRFQSNTLFTEFFLGTRKYSRTKLMRPLPMYASGSKMLSRFEMARQVAAEEAQQKKEAVKEAEEATRRVEELSKQETEYLAQIETLEKRLERAKRRAAEEVKKTRDQGIHDFLDGNAGRADDGLEIYELGFVKAKEMFVECFPDIPLDDFVLPAVSSVELTEGDTIVMGSDELLDNVFDHIIDSTMATSGDVADAAKALADLAYKHSVDFYFDSPYSLEARARGLDIPWWKKLLGAKLTGMTKTIYFPVPIVCPILFLMPRLSTVCSRAGGKLDDITVIVAQVKSS
ncbi:hypothetical protein RJ639_015106 [Escallonia herrerae]|uniref:Protein phosphatase n=1 Tax=Escallonia herrerae TaxID=1293975 RepID=A0AA88VKS9_9ASTE|nr:hypothetical protein RJ639_015106 [Escallonia herrerae]